MTIHANIGGVEKQGTEVWCNIAGVWKKAEKLMVNINGVWKDGGLEKILSYFGTATDLSVATYSLTGASVGNYALFAGGGASPYTTVVTAYDATLTRSLPTGLSVARTWMGGASVGTSYALFAGGIISGGTNSNVVDAYNTSLTASTPTTLSTTRYNVMGASVGVYALFVGGFTTNYVSTVNAYNDSLVRTTPTSLTTARGSSGVASVGNYVLFVGGNISGSTTSTVETFNTSLVKGTATSHLAYASIGGAGIADYAVFAGGVDSNNAYHDDVVAYNTSLVKTTATKLSAVRTGLIGSSLGGNALFAFGFIGTAVEVFSPTLVRSTLTTLSQRSDVACSQVGDYSLYAGGGTGVTTVDVFQYK